MDGEDQTPLEIELPGAVDEWLGRVATQTESSREEVMVRLLEAHESLAGETEADTTGEEFDLASSSEVDNLASKVRALAEALGEEVGDDQEPTEQAVTDRLSDIEESLTNVTGSLLELEERVAAVESGTEYAGQPPPSPRPESQGSAPEGHARLVHITRRAAETDITEARCGACKETVDITLLAEPVCPFCEAELGDINPGDGLFDQPRLMGRPGRRPDA